MITCEELRKEGCLFERAPSIVVDSNMRLEFKLVENTIYMTVSVAETPGVSKSWFYERYRVLNLTTGMVEGFELFHPDNKRDAQKASIRCLSRVTSTRP
jgi:hypothetical protein